jgi:hypothetical protein
MANILIAWQDGVPDRLSRVAAIVARGAATVTTARLCRLPLDEVDADRLRWCDALAMGVQSDPPAVAATLDQWRQSLEPELWEAVQGKFAAVFAGAPQEADKRARAHGLAERLLSAHGMLLTRFSAETPGAPAAADPLSWDRGCQYERMGRLLSGMAHAWVHQAGEHRRRRVLGSLVRATRRVPAMRPGPAGAGHVLSRCEASGGSDGIAPGT